MLYTNLRCIYYWQYFQVSSSTPGQRCDNLNRKPHQKLCSPCSSSIFPSIRILIDLSEMALLPFEDMCNHLPSGLLHILKLRKNFETGTWWDVVTFRQLRCDLWLKCGSSWHPTHKCDHCEEFQAVIIFVTNSLLADTVLEKHDALIEGISPITSH